VVGHPGEAELLIEVVDEPFGGSESEPGRVVEPLIGYVDEVDRSGDGPSTITSLLPTAI
jgi:hypothetical protein